MFSYIILILYIISTVLLFISALSWNEDFIKFSEGCYVVTGLLVILMLFKEVM